MQALPVMPQILSQRPQFFATLDAALDWAVASGKPWLSLQKLHLLLHGMTCDTHRRLVSLLYAGSDTLRHLPYFQSHSP